MDPIIGAALIGILLMIVIGGVWGYTIISGIMQRRLLEADGGAHRGLLEDLRTDYQQLEGRLSQMEDELTFLRELQSSEERPALPDTERSEK
jgi:hypothetical protein